MSKSPGYRYNAAREDAHVPKLQLPDDQEAVLQDLRAQRIVQFSKGAISVFAAIHPTWAPHFGYVPVGLHAAEDFDATITAQAL